jgi:hypothetical protein
VPRIRLLLLTLPMLVLSAGCGSDDPEADDSGPIPSVSTGSSSPSTDSSPEPTACDLLTDSQVAALAGQPLNAGEEATIGATIPACQWGSLDDVGVQAGIVDAGLWAHSLPDLVTEFQASGALDEENVAKLEEAAELVESGREIADDRACELFSDLVELNGLPAGSNLTVNLLPSAEDPVAFSAQTCRNGRFASVLVVRPDISGSAVEARSARAALLSLME